MKNRNTNKNSDLYSGEFNLKHEIMTIRDKDISVKNTEYTDCDNILQLRENNIGVDGSEFCHSGMNIIRSGRVSGVTDRGAGVSDRGFRIMDKTMGFTVWTMAVTGKRSRVLHKNFSAILQSYHALWLKIRVILKSFITLPGKFRVYENKLPRTFTGFPVMSYNYRTYRNEMFFIENNFRASGAGSPVLRAHIFAEDGGWVQ